MARKDAADPAGTADALRVLRPDLDKRHIARVRLGEIKLWLDGEPCTARMSQPYAGAPPGITVVPDYRGYGQVPDAVINAAFDR